MATDTLPHAASIIGAVVPRIDGSLKTTGAARYAADHNFPNLVHAVAVQANIGKGQDSPPGWLGRGKDAWRPARHASREHR